MRIRDPSIAAGLAFPEPQQRRMHAGQLTRGGRDLLLPGAYFAADFTRDMARLAGVNTPIANIAGLAFTRASTKYALNAAGVLLPFASGAMARTDRGLLVEGARTNLCLQSQTFDNASWTKSQATVTADQAAAPDGTLTADKFAEDNTSNFHRLQQNVTVSSGVVHTLSAFFKANERSWVYLLDTNTANSTAWFNVSTGTVGTVQASATATMQALGGGWYRCSVQFTSASTTCGVRLGIANADNTASYAGDGSSSVYVWGAQLEAAAGASSYTPTTTASATRAADVAAITGLVISEPLTLYVETEVAAVVGSNQFGASINDNSSNNRIQAGFGSALAGDFTVFSGGALQANLLPAGPAALGAILKMAGAAAADDVRAYLGATSGTPDTSALAATGLNKLSIGTREGGATPCFSYVRKLAIWVGEAKANAALLALTT